MTEVATRTQVEHLYRRYAPLLLRRSEEILGSGEAAREVVSSLFSRIRHDLRELREAPSPSAWLLTASTSECLSRLLARGEEGEGEPSAEAEGGGLPSLLAHLRRCSPERRTLVVLARVDEMTPEEIAGHLGADPAPVRRYVRRFARPSLSGHPTRHRWRLLVAGEVEDGERGRMLAHVHGCPMCRRWQERAESEHDRWLAAHPFDRMWPGMAERPGLPQEGGGREGDGEGSLGAWLLGVTGVAAVLILSLLAPWGGEMVRGVLTGERPAATREAQLYAWVDRGEGVRPLAAGARVEEGASLQFTWSESHLPYLVLLGTSSSGEVRVLYPPAGPPLPMGTGSGLVLPGSFPLTGTGGPQAFMAVVADRALPVEEVVGAVTARLNTHREPRAWLSYPPGEEKGRVRMASTWVEVVPPAGEGRGESLPAVEGSSPAR